MITCKSGITIRTGIADIREAGRATQGVKLIRLDEGDEIAAITKLDEYEEEAEDLVVEEGAAIEGATPTTPATENEVTDIVWYFVW